MASVAATQRERVDHRKIPMAALFGGALGIVVNVVVWAIAQFLLNLNVQIQAGGPTSPPETLTVVPVIVATLVSAIGAGVVFWLVSRFVPRPYTTFMVIAVLFLLVSFVPMSLLQVSGGSKIALGTMHIGAATSIVWSLLNRTRAT